MISELGEASLNELAVVLQRTPLALAVIDLASNRLTLVNAPFAALLGLDASELEGLDFPSLVSTDARDIIEHVVAGVANGLIDSCQGQGRLYSPNGASFGIVGAIQSLDAATPRAQALVVAAPADEAPLADPWLTLDPSRVAFGAIDHFWRFSEISADAARLLDWDRHERRGTPLQGVVHPDDVSLLLLTLGRSSTERRAAATRLRVESSNGQWTPVRLAVSPLCDHNPSRFAVALWCPPSGEDCESPGDRTSRLEDHLWRIAAEVQAAGIGEPPRSGHSWWADPMLRGLSRRQWEILRRLTRGERVPAIARELIVSQSTVRNHLSEIYRKVGVHSQSELLTRLMPATEAPNDRGRRTPADFDDSSIGTGYESRHNGP